MKNIFLLFGLICLSACSTRMAPYCEHYELKTKNETVRLALNNGFVQKEIKTKYKTKTENGLFTFENNDLHLFIKNKEEIYILKDDDLISKNKPSNIFECH